VSFFSRYTTTFGFRNLAVFLAFFPLHLAPSAPLSTWFFNLSTKSSAVLSGLHPSISGRSFELWQESINLSASAFVDSSQTAIRDTFEADNS